MLHCIVSQMKTIKNIKRKAVMSYLTNASCINLNVFTLESWRKRLRELLGLVSIGHLQSVQILHIKLANKHQNEGIYSRASNLEFDNSVALHDFHR